MLLPLPKYGKLKVQSKLRVFPRRADKNLHAVCFDSFPVKADAVDKLADVEIEDVKKVA